MINKYPTISIVMPSFNQGAFIERSILSIINQEYPSVQLIVIDGGSTDGTIDILKKYDYFIDCWISENDRGQSDALNKGFALATGDIFGWLNSDDLYLPNAFFSAASALAKHTQKMIVFGDWLSIDDSDNIIDYNHAFNFSLNHFMYEGFHLNAQSMFWRSTVHSRFSGFDIGLYNTMDYQMILEFGLNFGEKTFLRISKELAAFRRYEGQKTSGFTDRVRREHLQLARTYNYRDKYSIFGYFKRFLYRFRRAYWYLYRGGLITLANRILKSINNRNS